MALAREAPRERAVTSRIMFSAGELSLAEASSDRSSRRDLKVLDVYTRPSNGDRVDRETETVPRRQTEIVSIAKQRPLRPSNYVN